MKPKITTISFRISSEKEIVPVFEKNIQTLSKKQKRNFSSQLIQDLMTAFTEGIANAIRHGLELEKHKAVLGTIRASTKKIEMVILDHGPGFALGKVPTPRFEELAESGRGIFMMRQLMDEVIYKKGGVVNKLILRRNFAESGEEARNLNFLYEMSESILRNPDPALVYQVILDRALEMFKVERASILILDPKTNKLTVVASCGMTETVKNQIQVRPGEGVSGYVFLHAKPCLIEDIDNNVSGWDRQKQYKSASFISAPMICSPMRLGHESIGVINMTDRLDGKPFTKKDLRLLTTISNQASAYLYICHLINRLKESEGLRRDLEIARKIQQSYLPPEPPKITGLKLAGWCETASKVGGDYFDFIPDGDSSVFIVIADISGHDVAAAMTMANFRSQLKTIFQFEKKPSQILMRLNRFLYEDLIKNDQFVSAILFHLDTKKNTVEWVNAGHVPPLFLRENKWSALDEGFHRGCVLGVNLDENYVSNFMELKENDFLFLLTDGLCDNRRLDKETYGLERIQSVIKKNRDDAPMIILDKLKSELKTFFGNDSLTDDMTAVLIKMG